LAFQRKVLFNGGAAVDRHRRFNWLEADEGGDERLGAGWDPPEAKAPVAIGRRTDRRALEDDVGAGQRRSRFGFGDAADNNALYLGVSLRRAQPDEKQQKTDNKGRVA